MYTLLFIGLLAKTVVSTSSKEPEESWPTEAQIQNENSPKRDLLGDIEEISARDRKLEIESRNGI